MASWIYDEKFLMGMQFLFGTSSFTAAHDDDLEHPAHEQEVHRTMMIDCKFPRSLKNSATMFQAVVRQSTTTDLIDGPTRPPIGTSSTTTRSSGSTMIKFGSSSSSCTPLQPILQHNLTARANLWDKSGLTLQNRCALSDQQATCHQLRRNLFKPNQQGTTSPNEAA
jgi:hypothetical protein